MVLVLVLEIAIWAGAGGVFVAISLIDECHGRHRVEAHPVGDVLTRVVNKGECKGEWELTRWTWEKTSDVVSPSHARNRSLVSCVTKLGRKTPSPDARTSHP